MDKMSCQERIIEIVETLKRYQLEGLRNKELAKELALNEAMICRDLTILEKRGWIERSIETGRWRLSMKFARLGEKTADFYRKMEVDA